MVSNVDGWTGVEADGLNGVALRAGEIHGVLRPICGHNLGGPAHAASNRTMLGPALHVLWACKLTAIYS